jgi:hypothetical protein
MSSGIGNLSKTEGEGWASALAVDVDVRVNRIEEV